MKGTQRSLKKWWIPGLDGRKYRNLEYTAVPERKEVLKSDMGMPNTEANFKNVHNGKTWDNLSIKVMRVMDHLLLSKRNLIP